MKTFIIATLAASMLATPVLAAPPQHGDHGRGRVEQTHRVVTVQKRVVVQDRGYHGWRKGERFDQRRATRFRVISAPRSYRLNDAPRGYRWVQSGNDAVLVGITSGVIAAVMANVIR